MGIYVEINESRKKYPCLNSHLIMQCAITLQDFVFLHRNTKLLQNYTSYRLKVDALPGQGLIDYDLALIKCSKLPHDGVCYSVPHTVGALRHVPCLWVAKRLRALEARGADSVLILSGIP